jgi:hypothetical protein
VNSTQDQTKELNNIYNFSVPDSPKTSHRQLMNLVTSIAENGYQNEIEPIIAVQDGDKFVVQDANRRLSSIKLLNDPNKYKDLLDSHDFDKLEKLRTEFQSNIPHELEIVVLPNSTEEDKKQIREILNRKHNGPSDGAGTVQWNAQAKDRYFNRNNTFADKLEKPFEDQFGESLTSYLGGSNSVTSTRRIFNAQAIKTKLNIPDIDKLTAQNLDDVKALADKVKQYCDEHKMLLSRLSADDFQDITNPMSDASDDKKTDSASFDQDQILSESRDEFLNNQIPKLDRNLGTLWMKSSLLDLSNENFKALNTLLFALEKFGQLTGGLKDRWLKAYILSPSVRSFYELALLGLSQELPNSVALPYPVSTKHRENVDHVHSLFKENTFKTAVSQDNGVFTTYNEAVSIIDGTNFGESVSLSQLTAHKSMKDLDMDKLIALFNDAVLFALLTEQYVIFKKPGYGPAVSQTVPAQGTTPANHG